MSNGAGVTVVAWGTNGGYMDRDRQVLKFLKDPHCLVLTKDGHPHHPLRLRKNLKPVPYYYRSAA